MKEKWMLEAKRADFNSLGQRFGISPVLARLIVNRGHQTEEEINRYLNCDLSLLYDGRLMKDMNKAVELVVNAIKAGETIAIGTDFDNDGILSGYTLHYAIERVGGKALLYAPDRVSEGYGLNRRIVDDAKAAGSNFIITCDNGIAAFDAINYAKSLGMTVVVTDHHEVAFTEKEEGSREFILPNADAVVNPKQEDCAYPFKGLCGAGIAFKLICVLYEEFSISIEEAYQLLEYTAIATVADVMDLVDENRIIVKYGLSLLSNTQNIGLRALMEECSINMDRLSSYHIGFVIGPCFNAAGRLDTVAMAFDLLQATNQADAVRLAKELRDLNESRKEMTQEGVDQAMELIEQSNIKDDKVLVIKLEHTHESLVGIIAGRVRERYHKPALVFVDVEDGVKGSGRSIEAYNMFEELLKCKDLLSKFGGHPMAAGLSLPAENLEALRKRLNENTTLTENDLIPVVKIDVPLPIGYLKLDFIDELERLEPFGKGNVKPVFAEQHFRVRKAVILGKNQNVLKLTINNSDGCEIDALYFGDIPAFNAYVEEIFGVEETRKMYHGQYNNVDLAFTYYPSINDYMGRQTVQIIIQNYCHIPRK
ncbi:MAG: single-stranded-DNA-specific exonuclease RecJ [Clostridiales bacterium]|nr:single-stranded-DNA-specific exonuclease RecJ [Clostridiales bacterium]